MYMKGLGVELDNNMAFRYFKQAAEKGDVAGMSNLGVAYLNGIGTPQDID